MRHKSVTRNKEMQRTAVVFSQTNGVGRVSRSIRVADHSKYSVFNKGICLSFEEKQNF